MMKTTAQRAEQARREARELFVRDRAKEQEVVKERERAFAATTQKTDRLRALRLAREAKERDTTAAEVVEPAPKPKAKKARKAKAKS